jgi:hypothetical protein
LLTSKEETDLSKFKIGVFGLVAGLMVAFGAFGLGRAVPDAQADFVKLYKIPSLAIAQLDDDFRDFGNCGGATGASSVGPTSGATPTSPALGGPVVNLGPGQSIWFCLVLDDGEGNAGTDSADVTFDSNDVGKWTNAICANNDGDGDFFEVTGDECVSIEGLNTDELTVDCTEQLGTPSCSSDAIDGPDAGTTADAELGGILVEYKCTDTFTTTTITISISDPDDGNETYSFTMRCFKEVASLTIEARPTTVEIVPARSNTSHSFVDVTLKDSLGNPANPDVEIDFTVDRCSIETAGVSDSLGSGVFVTNRTLRAEASVMTLALSTANPLSYFTWETSSYASAPVDSGLPTLTRQADSTFAAFSQVTLDTKASAILGCNPVDAPGATPGVATITACAEIVGPDICVSTTVTVIGPPASITVAASPSSLRCGEKSTVTATVKDAIGQNVSDHTRVEFITNLGGVIAGQGAVAGFAGPVVPISSSVGDTFGGVSTAFLLTSESHSGPYEVVATSGGTAAFDPELAGYFSSGSSSATQYPGINVLGGIFSTPPISAQATVTCNIPAPTVAPAATVTAPRTGTGIVPPNTGDAGLAGSSSSSWTLFAIGGLAAFALAGLASLKFARR